MEKELIAPCGMNCRICVAYFGYTLNGKKRKHSCRGCRVDNKKCAFIKKHCEKIYQGVIEFCFQCRDFPCIHLKKIDSRYREKYQMSLIKNLEFIRDFGMDRFLEEQQERYQCADCGELKCVHTEICYHCES